MTEKSSIFNTGNATYVFNALRHVASGSLHRDVLVPIKVDPRRAVAAREQLLLNPLVSRQPKKKICKCRNYVKRGLL